MKTVKILPSGKIKLRLSKSLKPVFLSLLQMFLNNLECNIKNDRKLTYHNYDERVSSELLQEVYVKHHTTLCIIDQESKINLTRAQAHTLWGMCMEWSDDAFQNPEMGGLLLELHRSLS